MRLTLGIVAGISLALVVWIMKQPTLDMLFNRDNPPTPGGHQPKAWTSHGGVITKGTWT